MAIESILIKEYDLKSNEEAKGNLKILADFNSKSYTDEELLEKYKDVYTVIHEEEIFTIGKRIPPCNPSGIILNTETSQNLLNRTYGLNQFVGELVVSASEKYKHLIGKRVVGNGEPSAYLPLDGFKVHNSSYCIGVRNIHTISAVINNFNKIIYKYGEGSKNRVRL